MEHYILEGVIALCFWSFRNLGTFEYAIKNNAGVTPWGVVYTLRSVLRGLNMSSKAHFTGVYIPQRGCFSVCLLHRFPKTSNDERADASTHVFLCSQQIRKNNLTLGVCRNKKKDKAIKSN